MARGFSFFDEALVGFKGIGPDYKTTQRLQQLFRMQFSATVSSMMGKKTKSYYPDIFFKRADRIESSKEPEPVPSASGMSELALALYLLYVDSPSALRFLTSSPSSSQ